MSLERDSQAQGTRLESVLAAVLASNDNVARIGQALTRNEPYNRGFASTLPQPLSTQSISMAPAMSTVQPQGVAPPPATYQEVQPLRAVQPQIAPYQTRARPMGQNIGHYGPPPLSAQPAAPVPQAGLAEMAGGRNGGQVPAHGPSQLQAGHCGPPPPPAQTAALVPQVGLADIQAHVDEIICKSFNTEVRPAIRLVFRSLYPAHIDTDHLYLAN